jgi:exopolyphosphatase/guanosine-5'-triphosphate,3'-diphosphate pyrophosphatase
VIRVAVGDIGTNTARLLVADVQGSEVAEVEVRTEVVGLGRGLHGTGQLQPDAIERAVDALGSFSDAFADADFSIIVATSASRDAGNREVFFDEVERACGVRPTLISGEVEARFSFEGASQAVPDRRITVIDIGGGSTEFVTGRSGVEASVSVDIGSVRLTDLYLGGGPVSAEKLANARSVTEGLFGGVDVQDSEAVVGVAGTCTTVAGTLLGLTEHDRSIVHLSTISLEGVEGLLGRLATLPTEEIAGIGTIGTKRAPVIVGGLIVLVAALRTVGASGMVVSERDLLHGVAVGLVSG